MKKTIDLLAPRRKLIINYPFNIYRLGSIFTLRGGWWFNNEHEQGLPDSEVKKCPEVFKEISWWEDREIDEMPEYIRSKNKVRKVPKWEGKMAVFNKNIPYNKDIAWMPTGEWLPATEAEYLEYQNKQK